MKKKVDCKILGVIAISFILLWAKSVSAAETTFRATNITYQNEKVWDGKGEPNASGSESNTSRLFGGGTPRLYLYHVKTSATDPCPNCKFSIRTYLDVLDNGLYVYPQKFVTFQMGQTKNLDTEAGVGQPCVHYLGGKRTDWTLQNLGATIFGWFGLGNY